MNNTITEVKDTIEGVNSTLDDAEEWISKLKNSSGNHPNLTVKK